MTNDFPDPILDSDHHIFSVLLDADSAVDHLKLRRAAFSGVPPQQRPQVWSLLLAIAPFDKSDDVALKIKRIHDYTALSAHVDMDDPVPRSIHRLLKRSKTVYQPSSLHDRRPSRHSSSSSGDSFDPDDDDDTSSDTLLSTAPIVSHLTPNRRNHIRHTHHSIPRPVDRTIHSKFSRIITTFLERTGSSLQFDIHMVHLCAPFIEIMPTEADAYYAFSALINRYDYIFTEHGLREATSDFITIFRTLHPSLFDKFVLEEVDIKSFVRKWLRGLLVQQLPRRSLLRLWDSYFANDNGLKLHPFVCIVYIEHLKPELQDCDDSEFITTLVGRLPAMDIDHVIAHAMTVREQLKERGVVL